VPLLPVPDFPDDAYLDTCSVHKFKGLERKVVILVDVERVKGSAQMLNYVGTTRACDLLIVLMSNSAKEAVEESAWQVWRKYVEATQIQTMRQ